MTFNEWKQLSMVREYVPQIVKIDLEKISTWREYISAVYHADRSKIHARVDKLLEKIFEEDEYIALMAITWTMDYASITHEIAINYGFGSFMSRLSRAGPEARQIVAGALLQRN